MIKETEITEKHLNNILTNTHYRQLKTFDFIQYDVLIRKRKRHIFETEELFLAYKKEMLAGISAGTYDKPCIVIDETGTAECIDGEIRLLTSKVLGIDPVVELSFTDKTQCKIENYRLASLSQLHI